ncbi:hypothetical protein [Deinococcus multiflagellatus]|uniref:Uncharacterized protein n=2 Tax=Deinococcus multiflagellatus TaxID=1656887 RepID=A0ABW1ZSD2_9DEIO
MSTLFFRALDRLVGAVKIEKPTGPTIADPNFRVGDGCTVKEQPGVVQAVKAGLYQIRLVSGEDVTVHRDRQVQLGWLGRLEQAPELPQETSGGIPAGALYHHTGTGLIVQVKEQSGGFVVLDNGERILLLEFNRLYRPGARASA